MGVRILGVSYENKKIMNLTDYLKTHHGIFAINVHLIEKLSLGRAEVDGHSGAG